MEPAWPAAGTWVFACTILLLVMFGNDQIAAKTVAKWGNWADITACTARPFNCTGDEDQAAGAPRGYRVQMRWCDSPQGSGACKAMDDVGPFRKKGCDNVNVCPGWSEWSEFEPCWCHRDVNGTLVGSKVRRRHCTNPAPIHPKVLCINVGGNPSLEGDEELPCECTDYEEPTTTTTEAPLETTTELLPCCGDDDYPDYDGNSSVNISLNPTNNSTTTPEPVPERDDADAYYWTLHDGIMNSPDCRPCNETYSMEEFEQSANVTTEIPELVAAPDG